MSFLFCWYIIGIYQYERMILMELNTRPLAETIGTIAGTRTLFNGQANTHLYNDEERKNEFNNGTRDRNLATAWEEQPLTRLMGQVDE